MKCLHIYMYETIQYILAQHETDSTLFFVLYCFTNHNAYLDTELFPYLFVFEYVDPKNLNG